MKYIYLTIFISLLIATTLCENTSFLKIPASSNSGNGTEANAEPEPKSYKGFCFMKMKNYFYDLRPFNMIKPWKLIDKNGKILNFNFCSNIDTKCHPEEALMADIKTCKKFAGQSDQEKIWTLGLDNYKKEVITLKLPAGDSCGNGKYYQTTIQLTCDKKANVPTISNNKSFDQTNCQNIIKIRSKQGIY